MAQEKDVECTTRAHIAAFEHTTTGQDCVAPLEPHAPYKDTAQRRLPASMETALSARVNSHKESSKTPWRPL